MEVIIPVAILFGIGFGAGFAMRVVLARQAEARAALQRTAMPAATITPPSFKPRSSLRAFDLHEDPIWGR